MPNVTGTTELPNAVDNYFDRTLLARVKPRQIHAMLAKKKNLPSGNSDTIKFRRMSNLTTATVPLTEGVTPPGQKMSLTDMTLKLEQYGKAA